MNPWTTHPDEHQTTLMRITSLAQQNNFVLNSDRDRVEKVVGLMTENFVSTGKYFCPCKQFHPLNPAVDVVCPCPTWKEEIKTDGHCFCRLFFKNST